MINVLASSIRTKLYDYLMEIVTGLCWMIRNKIISQNNKILYCKIFEIDIRFIKYEFLFITQIRHKKIFLNSLELGNRL